MRFQRPQLEIVDFIAIECELQRSGERSVSRMVQAWSWAMHEYGSGDQPPPLHKNLVRVLGRIIDPDKNDHGFRLVPVQVRAGHAPVGARPEHIERQVDLLCDAQFVLTPAEFYKQFEEIHPFLDGNGRLGQLLFNYLSHTLGSPTMAPDFWNDPRRGT